MAAWFLDIFIEYIFRVSFRAANLMRSRNWPVITATISSADCPHAGYGCTVATVYYEYIVRGEKYGDTFKKPFISYESGAVYAAQFVKGADFKIRVRPHEPTISIPL
jgi:hypothetical protein